MPTPPSESNLIFLPKENTSLLLQTGKMWKFQTLKRFSIYSCPDHYAYNPALPASITGHIDYGYGREFLVTGFLPEDRSAAPMVISLKDTSGLIAFKASIFFDTFSVVMVSELNFVRG